MEKLHYFGPKAAALLKLTGPVSSLLIEGMSGILKGDSEELKLYIFYMIKLKIISQNFLTKLIQ
ncbi:hypothetical protein Mgra_00005613 [Meloidogyne graminicola]|uniref:Uncharacterized protein n=1 Tax=Meloidogyne graminicola TaxID=189291 RepID=A0A8S9ZNZ6_9BILA|nr:hypothetical protein Mgra_00005613 [Meloidogyne graminicola]